MYKLIAVDLDGTIKYLWEGYRRYVKEIIKHLIEQWNRIYNCIRKTNRFN